MYRLQTSTGFQVETSTVEQVATALSGQFHRGTSNIGWTVVTPHGTVLSEHDLTSLTSSDDADIQSDRAYALLVRDHLTRGSRQPSALATGLFHTTR